MDDKEYIEDVSALLERLAADDALRPEEQDERTVRELCRRMPYSAVSWLLALRSEKVQEVTEETEEEVRSHLFMTSSAASTLNYASQGEAWSRFYPAAAEPESMGTEQVIDTFLTRYATTTPEEEALLEKMIFNPTPDYGEMLAREESETLPTAPAPEQDGEDARIASFILSHHPAIHTPEPVPEPEDDPLEEPAPVHKPETEAEGLLSESLAAIFIRQGRYQKAFDIISSLNLKFPKKSAYFADQLRFLRKLMLNQERLSKGQGSATQP